MMLPLTVDTVQQSKPNVRFSSDIILPFDVNFSFRVLNECLDFMLIMLVSVGETHSAV